MQNIPYGYTEVMTESDARKPIGNGWNEKTGRYIFDYLKKEEKHEQTDKDML